MTVRAIVLVLAALGALGCNVAAPIVGTRPPSAEEGAICEAPSCDVLDAAPPPALLAELRGPDAACPDGRLEKSLLVEEDSTVDAQTLDCVHLVVEVVGEGSTTRVLTVQGDALARAGVEVRSAGLPVELRLAVGRIDRSEILVSGAVEVIANDTIADASRFVLESTAPLAAPQLSFAGGAMTDVEIMGPRAMVRLDDVHVRGAIAAVSAIVLDRGLVDQADLQADSIEMLAADVTSSDLDVEALVAASGTLQSVHVRRCAEITLSDLALVSSYVVACDAPLDVRGVSFSHDVLLGDVVGTGGTMRDTVFGGARLALAGAEVFSSAFCGTEQVAVRRITCVSCGSAAPADMCGIVSGAEAFCPGLCTSTCAATGEPTLPREACAS